MADDYNAELAKERHGIVMSKLEELVTEQKRTNGRLTLNERDVAVLQERNPGRQGGAWGAVAGALGGFLAGFIKP